MGMPLFCTHGKKKVVVSVFLKRLWLEVAGHGDSLPTAARNQLSH